MIVLRRTITLGLAVLIALMGAISISSGAAAGGLRNDYVTAGDGSTYPVTAYNATRKGEGIYVYDSSWGSTTQQNQWGSEAVVQGGVVTSITAVGKGGNAAVPKDGFTLSGRDSGATWMISHLAVGQKVSIEKDVINQTSVTVSTTVTKVNPSPPFEFPGGRGGDELVAYTEAYSAPRTGTNQFGTEAVAIAEGAGYRVTTVGGNDSTIPKGGLVISGHGVQMAWIQKNVIVGTTLTLDRTTRALSATTDATSYLFQASEAITRAANAVTAGRAAFADAPLGQAETTLKAARALLDTARRQHSAGEDKAAITNADNATQTAVTARQLTVESHAVETRGVWHRPAEASAAEVDATVAAMHKAGINQLYLESFFGGRTIYPTSLAEQNASFKGWDPMAAYVSACGRYGINLHLWMHTFYVGTDAGDGSGTGSPVARQHPDWLVIDRSGRNKSVTEPGYYFVDPAVPAARAWLLDLFHEAVTKYHVSGLQLDYIRYPAQGGAATVSSYNEIARAAFSKQHGVDPTVLTPEDPRYQTWLDWETEQVTQFVRDARHRLPSSVQLSTALETSNNDVDILNFHQDFTTWVHEKLLDTVAPEVYTSGVADVLQQTRTFGQIIGNNAFTSIGLAPSFVGASPDVSVDQVVATQQAGATGAVNFVWRSMTTPYQEALARSVYRRPALDPQEAPVAATVAQVKDMQRRVVVLYDPALSEAQQRSLDTTLGQLRRDLEKQRFAQAARDVRQVESRLAAVDTRPIRQRLTTDLGLLTHILDVAKPIGWPIGWPIG